MSILEAVQSVATPWLDVVALTLTNLGSEEAYIALLVALYLGVDARAGRVLGLGLLASYAFNQHAKAAFDTVRPYVLHPELLRGGQAAAGTGPGAAFPSGHAQSAATFWGLAAMLGRRRWLAVLAVVWIAVMSWTRLYLGVHWPIDVLGGIALGLAFAASAWALSRRPRIRTWTLRAVVFVALPIALHLLAPTPESGLLAGAFAGVASAPWLWPHRARGPWVRRVGLAVLGLGLAVGWLLGTSVLLPEAVKDHRLVEPLRYLLLAWIGLAGAPALVARGRRAAGKSRT